MHTVEGGVVLYLTQAGTETAVNDRDGNAMTAQALVAGQWFVSSTVSMKNATFVQVTLYGAINDSQSMLVRLEARRADSKNQNYLPFGAVQSVRADSGDPNSEHTFTASTDFQSTVDATQGKSVFLQTTDNIVCDEARVLVQFQNPISADEYMVVEVAGAREES